MDKVEILRKELSIYKRNKKLLKHITQKEGEHLHSGELSVVDFISRYHKESDAFPTLVHISNSLAIKQSTVTVLVNRLIEKEIIVKTPSPENKSKKLVSLTEKGIFLLEKRRQKDQDRLLKLIEFLGEEDTENLAKLIVRINEFYQGFLDLERAK